MLKTLYIHTDRKIPMENLWSFYDGAGDGAAVVLGLYL